MIILDTNVISELMRATPDPSVVAWADRQSEATIFVTAITLAEIRFGLASLPAGRRRAALSAAFEDGIRPTFGTRVLDFDESASRAYGELRAEARAKGAAVGDVDAMIAAIARVHRCDVATRDVAPFRAAGVRVVNPFDEG
ncbi:MAG TPA: type II toxin-antitoxin system VapC family toxin [Nocardioides sp.]|uniref:type II toxin-antitoxin system VapC family toxin n=1 Tax=Nocardioides sp. TaxID=35761 RepID=UPI002ED906E6